MFEAPFSFSGRIRRTEYGLSLIINSVLSFFISLIVRGTNGDAVFFIYFIYPYVLVYFGTRSQTFS